MGVSAGAHGCVSGKGQSEPGCPGCLKICLTSVDPQGSVGGACRYDTFAGEETEGQSG